MDLGNRISVVGTSGSGKTTLAILLSRTLDLPHYELDALNWLPNWRQRDADEFRKIVSEKVRGESWVMEGNYSRTRDIVWSRATTVVWLNMPFHLVFYRMIVRIFRRGLRKEELWNGNRETLARHFFTKDSMLLWVIKTHGKKRREYRALFKDDRYKQLNRIELRGRKDVARFLDRVASGRKEQSDESR
jgi:adenylate kinase family enzyme